MLTRVGFNFLCLWGDASIYLLSPGWVIMKTVNRCNAATRHPLYIYLLKIVRELVIAVICLLF